MLILWLVACAVSEQREPIPGDSSTAVEVETSVTTPLPVGFSSLAGQDFSLGGADLGGLADIVAGGDVIAVGESVHYTDEYANIRSRLIRELVESHEVRAIGIEGHWLYAEQLTRPWVEDCEGSVESGLAGLYFGVWQSQASGELLQWLCEWNSDHPADKVTFFGTDVQAPWLDSSYLLPLFASVDPQGTEQIATDLHGCAGFGLTESEVFADFDVVMGPFAAETTQRCLAGVQAASNWIDANAAGIEGVEGPDGPTIARVALRSAHMGFLTYDNLRNWDARDLGMADNFLDLWTLRAPGERAVWWAHNAHLVDRGEDLTDSVYPQGWKNAGSLLADALGDGYVPIGFFGGDVSWDWPGYGAQSSVAAPNSLESSISTVDQPLLLVDVAAAVADGTVLRASEPHPFGHPGTATGLVENHYRGLVYIDVVTPMTYW